MAEINLNRPSSISSLIENGIINPEKIGKFYQYTETEVSDYLEYKQTGVHKYVKHLDSDNFTLGCLKSVSTHSLVIELLERTDTQRKVL
jgi:hypothetical protein